MTIITTKPNTIILLLLTAFASVAAVLYTPALPAIMQFFTISAAKAQLTMSLFLIAYALGPLFYGPLSHRYGRKPTLYAGILLGLIGIGLCIIAYYNHIYAYLVIGRFIEGLGTSVGLVIAFTMVNDVYQGSEARKILSLTTLAFACLPAAGIFVGGLLLQQFAWVSSFYFSAAYTFFILICCRQLPETRPPTAVEKINLTNLLANYQRAFADKTLWSYALMWALTTAFVYLFATLAPLIVIKDLGFSPADYGSINVLSYLFLIAGNILSAKTTSRLTARQSILLGACLALLGSVLFATFHLLGILTIYTLYGSLCISFIGMPLILANASAQATAHIAAAHKAFASASISIINMGTAVVTLFIVSNLTLTPTASLSVAFVLLMLLEFVLLIATQKRK